MKDNIKYSLFSIRRYIFIFIMLCFVLTCSILLFTSGLHISLSNEKGRAIGIFVNIIFLSFIFTYIDGIYHRITIQKPVNSILEATSKITKGDFHVKIDNIHDSSHHNEFDIIIHNINTMARELESTETLRSDFIANVSHELKTPISIIKNHAQFIQYEDLTLEEIKEYAKIINDTSSNLNEMIMNILKLSKIENSKILVNKKDYNLSHQLIQCILQFESIWEKKNIDIDVHIKEDVIIHSDEELLSIVWNNLLSNAFKFSDNGGLVKISLIQDKEKITVSISDNGCGMSNEVGQHIFDKFYQGDTSHAVKGNGLGLALVKEIIELMNYDINVESALNEGSTFSITIY